MMYFDYDDFDNFDAVTEIPLAQALTERDRALIIAALTVMESRKTWRNGYNMPASEWDALAAELAELKGCFIEG